VLLPLPVLVYLLVPAYEAQEPALRAPFFERLRAFLGAARGAGSQRRRGVLGGVVLALGWALLVTAAAAPVVEGAPRTTQKSARDLLLLVDLSGSMETTDLTPGSAQPRSRLAVVKDVVAEFVTRRKGDRIGLVVFGTTPFVQVPFTLDTDVVQQLLRETDVGMAGPQTALGDAVGLALKTFARSDAKNRVAVLLTDGNDTGSLVPPVQAARIAASQGVTLHVVGVGDPRVVGEDRLNEDVLRTMSSLTHGTYQHASDAKGLAAFYRSLDEREPIVFEAHTYTPKETVFQWPLGIAVALSALAVLAVAAKSWVQEARHAG
jgi:Ca-activated chloride channel family protein